MSISALNPTSKRTIGYHDIFLKFIPDSVTNLAAGFFPWAGKSTGLHGIN
jgi:hypothetical protein